MISQTLNAIDCALYLKKDRGRELSNGSEKLKRRFIIYYKFVGGYCYYCYDQRSNPQ